MPRIIILFTWLLAIVRGYQILDFPDRTDRSSCIPLSRLQDGSVQRGLGELRKIKKVNLYLTGNGTIDVTVAVASSFWNDDFTKPSLHKCENYQGTSNDILVTMICRQSADSDGSYGYAVFVQFSGDLSNNSAAICQLEIYLGEKNAEENVAKNQSTAITFGVIYCLIVLTAICIVIWYWLTTREISTKEDQSLRETAKKEKGPLSNEDDYDDEVFILE